LPTVSAETLSSKRNVFLIAKNITETIKARLDAMEQHMAASSAPAKN
jgi:hypothetical protein